MLLLTFRGAVVLMFEIGIKPFLALKASSKAIQLSSASEVHDSLKSKAVRNLRDGVGRMSNLL